MRQNYFSRSSKHVRALDGISVRIMRGETVGLVGESGSGKSTLGRILVRLDEPTSGKVLLEGADIFSLKGKDQKAFRRRVQIVFQDPRGSLNPRKTIEKLLLEPMLVHGLCDTSGARRRAEEILEMVGLTPSVLSRYPHEFSGGERQRIGIARALTLGPEFIVADEPVTALDVSVQGQIINLLMDLQRELGLTYLLIAHDLCIVNHASTRVVVMYLGKIVEVAPAERLYRSPGHPYTEVLLSLMPGVEGTDTGDRTTPRGEPGDPSAPPSGCVFHPRCSYTRPECRSAPPAFKEIDKGHHVACIL